MTDASLTLTLSANIPASMLARLTRNLEHDLSRAGIQARPIEAPQVPGEKGEPISVGVLALALITSGAVTAVIECFKVCLNRERALTIKLTRVDGTQVEVTTHNVDTTAVRETLKAMASTKG